MYTYIIIKALSRPFQSLKQKSEIRVYENKSTGNRMVYLLPAG